MRDIQLVLGRWGALSRHRYEMDHIRGQGQNEHLWSI